MLPDMLWWAGAPAPAILYNAPQSNAGAGAPAHQRRKLLGLSGKIRNQALALGFDLVGLAPARRAEHADALFQWLESGCHAGMGWMARDPETRADPTRLLAGAKSIVCVALAYGAEIPPAKFWDDPLRGRVARFAWGPDYHDLIVPRLEELARFIVRDLGQPLAWKVAVDAAPILERDHAARAGLGYIGKSNILISPRFGSLLLLGEVLLDIGLDDYDSPQPQSCCAETSCAAACPTAALQPYNLDARRCISWLTIENKNEIPEALRPRLGRWIFGCDECQTSCPWTPEKSFLWAGTPAPAQSNTTAPKTRELELPPTREQAAATPHAAFRFQPEISTPRLDELLALDEKAFRERFAGTPLARAKRRGLLRNAAIALGNSGVAATRPALERAASDPDELIRAHAAWALQRLDEG
ncbi:MAG: tRNA epoxyqueuosine(34) reductase QueG [Verrucomicrobia bacterium]|nr:MAG: tRNA epoxyqueuosine(34) reductase QueG [Verrucomicrobiota bacterium]